MTSSGHQDREETKEKVPLTVKNKAAPVDNFTHCTLYRSLLKQEAEYKMCSVFSTPAYINSSKNRCKQNIQRSMVLFTS
jgi:hypothetical protein